MSSSYGISSQQTKTPGLYRCDEPKDFTAYRCRIYHNYQPSYPHKVGAHSFIHFLHHSYAGFRQIRDSSVDHFVLGLCAWLPVNLETETISPMRYNDYKA